MEEINKKIEELKQLFSDDTTFVKITISAQGIRVTTSVRNAETLKDQFISMRNVKGKFIKIIDRYEHARLLLPYLLCALLLAMYLP